jgi:sialic acid synthase SpsE
LYVVEDIAAGDVFTQDNVRSIRPGYGMAPKDLPAVIGKQAVSRLKKGTAMQKEFIKGWL